MALGTSCFKKDCAHDFDQMRTYLVLTAATVIAQPVFLFELGHKVHKLQFTKSVLYRISKRDTSLRMCFEQPCFDSINV